jgi:hypothetical protein
MLKNENIVAVWNRFRTSFNDTDKFRLNNLHKLIKVFDSMGVIYDQNIKKTKNEFKIRSVD